LQLAPLERKTAVGDCLPIVRAIHLLAPKGAGDPLQMPKNQRIAIGRTDGFQPLLT
jgi:hypothetical protein